MRRITTWIIKRLLKIKSPSKQLKMEWHGYSRGQKRRNKKAVDHLLDDIRKGKGLPPILCEEGKDPGLITEKRG